MIDEYHSDDEVNTLAANVVLEKCPKLTPETWLVPVSLCSGFVKVDQLYGVDMLKFTESRDWSHLMTEHIGNLAIPSLIEDELWELAGKGNIAFPMCRFLTLASPKRLTVICLNALEKWGKNGV